MGNFRNDYVPASPHSDDTLCGISREKAWTETVEVILNWVVDALHGDVNSLRLIEYFLEELGDDNDNNNNNNNNDNNNNSDGSHSMEERAFVEMIYTCAHSSDLDISAMDSLEGACIPERKAETYFSSLFPSPSSCNFAVDAGQAQPSTAMTSSSVNVSADENIKIVRDDYGYYDDTLQRPGAPLWTQSKWHRTAAVNTPESNCSANEGQESCRNMFFPSYDDDCDISLRETRESDWRGGDDTIARFRVLDESEDDNGEEEERKAALWRSVLASRRFAPVDPNDRWPFVVL